MHIGEKRKCHLLWKPGRARPGRDRSKRDMKTEFSDFRCFPYSHTSAVTRYLHLKIAPYKEWKIPRKYKTKLQTMNYSES